MKKTYVLFNPLSGNNRGEENSKKIGDILQDTELIYKDIREIKNYSDFLNEIEDEDIIICGGDGTLNHFVNDIKDIEFNNNIYLYPAGSGNDFISDIKKEEDTKLYLLNDYIRDLPTVFVNGKEQKFINGIGYGIDGYCCEEGDRIRAKSTKPINYTSIAIKGLLYAFKPRNAKITIDGKEYNYKKVWLAPTMNGRFFGGGMMIAPNQDRLNKEKKLSVVVAHDVGKFKILTIFPKIFKGDHLKYKKIIEVFEGYDVKVEFDKPCALQIDGETILNVKEYAAKSAVKLKV